MVDSDLVVRAQHGDRRAFTALVDAVGGRLHAIAFAVLRDRELARDATRQTLLTTWQELPRLRDADRFEAWACRILVRNCHREGRKASRWLPALPDRPGSDPVVVDGSGSVITRDRLERGFRRLNLDQRLAVVLHCYLDLPPAIIDRRSSGNSSSVHNYYRYDFAPQWGVRRFASVITNEDGSWVSTDAWGYQQPEVGAMFYAGRFRGTDAYEGLSALFVLSRNDWGMRSNVEGVIFPGDLPAAPEPPVEAATASD